MKKILILGKKSYIGNACMEWLSNSNQYKIEELDVKNNDWKYKSFSDYDIIFDVAGIVHINPSPDKQELFFRVNRDLTIRLAEKGRKDGVKQFIYMSSMNVFGDVAGKVKKNTKPMPTSFYGQSKLEADKHIIRLNSSKYKVAIIRPPMVYGKNCRGNYTKLSIGAKKFIFFPKFKNERSMIHIDNLCEFIKLIIDNECSGIYYPQNKDFVCTSDMVKKIAEVNNHRILMIPGFSLLIKFLIKRTKIFNKIFGTETYSLDMSNVFDYKYCINDFYDTIKKTEK